MDPLTRDAARDAMLDPVSAPVRTSDASRVRTLQALGIFCGLAAGAWLGAAEAPTKLVTIGLSPVVVSLTMVIGVFLARWSLPALIQGTSHVRADIRQAPHLIVWAILAGCLWAVANTLTIFAVRDVGLSIAFPLWNSNSLLGILWGILLFKELHGADWRRWLGVVGGALVMFGGACALALASAAHVDAKNAWHGIAAALAAGAMWGTMYIPYRKAYLTGMSPLSFVTFFTIGELGMMGTIAVVFSGGVAPLWRELASAREVLFWLLAGGFVWVIGDLFQQYAVKYAGITRGIPLSNTNQLWGLLWGVLVFGELRGGTSTLYTLVVGGSTVMALGAGLIALSSVSGSEHSKWTEAAEREAARYGVDREYTRNRVVGREVHGPTRRTWVDWLLVGMATVVLAIFASMARAPQLSVHLGWAAVLTLAMLLALAGCGLALWRTTKFN
ncbi:MAG TPA: EamA family transporter [Gemmatimonadaceae bacterium]|nr:EamA family transporter [Gemmatimonadaceae bacterium]